MISRSVFSILLTLPIFESILLEAVITRSVNMAEDSIHDETSPPVKAIFWIVWDYTSMFRDNVTAPHAWARPCLAAATGSSD